MRRRLAGAALALLLNACATPTRQTEALLHSDLPSARVLNDVPFVDQTEAHCGPATLAMALRYAGQTVTPEQLAPKVMGSQAGALPMEVLSAARREGFMAVEVSDLKAIAQEVEAGHPVIVFQNLGLGWLPRWHFALAVGYDLPKQEIVLHSGHESFRREPLRYFERSWTLADQWAMVVLPPGELAASAGELAHLRSASVLEQLQFQGEAALAYDAILKRWPNSLAALVGRANVAFAQKDFAGAIQWLRQATERHPGSVVARHNLEVAERALK